MLNHLLKTAYGLLVLDGVRLAYVLLVLDGLLIILDGIFLSYVLLVFFERCTASS